MQNKKNTIQVGVNEHNQKKVLDREHKNHKQLLIHIGNYRDISVQICQLVDDFRSAKFLIT